MTSHSQKYYRRFYRLVVLAVILMIAVLTGSLLLGDSVRGTLVQRVGERLGKTETVIISGTGFMDEALLDQPLLNHARGYLLMNGYVSVGEKLLPVYVWGTDADTLQAGEALVNEPLGSKLSSLNSQLILHLPSHNMVPSGSLFVTKSYATQMRLHVVGVKSVEEGGNILLRNEQTLPLNVFVNRRYLAETMELEGKINLVLSDDMISDEQFAAIWNPELSGIHITDSSLTSDGIFIPQEIVDKLTPPHPSRGKGKYVQTYFAYLVNEISTLNSQLSTLNYPFVTAVSEWQGERLEGQEMILSDYAAKRLHVLEGDSVSMSYFITENLKNLNTREQTFVVKRIVPLASFRNDSLLVADFPGLTHVEKCTDWDSDLPIDMNRIEKEDEDYWYAYRQTPKALVSYEAVAGDWSNAFGCATAMRFTSRPDVSLLPGDAEVQLVHPRAQGLQGATGGVDFAGLFLSLGFFIILSSVLLMKNPLVEMFNLRSGELQLYRQLGFGDKRIKRMLFSEVFGIIFLASPIGVIAGLAYSGLTLWLLGNVWSGATHTEGFSLHIRPLTLLAGWLVGLLICAFVLWRVIWGMVKGSGFKMSDVRCKMEDGRAHLRFGVKGSGSGSKLPLYSSFFIFLLTLGLIVFNFVRLHSIALFVICGLLWILTWGLFLRNSFQKIQDTPLFSRHLLTRLSIRAFSRQHLLAYWTLALGVFAVFAVGLNRPDFSHADQASGGYQYYVDSRVPIHYNLNNPEVRKKLSLQSLPDSTVFLSFLRHTQDEASCLNLNQVSTPTVLGVDLKEMASFGLNSQFSTLNSQFSIIVDGEALLWSLKKSVGDTLFYQNDRGETVPVVIAGTYPTGIFHGNAIMPVEDFLQLWPKEVGMEVLLMKSSRPVEAAELLSIAMSEYGLTIQTTEERIRMFFEVTETYLIIFLTLGGLGLLLGIFSLMIIVRKNLTAQADTIRQYHAMGFSGRLIRQLMLRENLLVPLYAVLAGATGSVISISANVRGAGLNTLLLALVILAAICLLLYYGIKIMINQSINNPE
ncbi:MAG: ABC transporter permease [Bacteroidaceae bacterium]|nr:ABC transporter permease [Bacteroidaceae bacterium]